MTVPASAIVVVAHAGEPLDALVWRATGQTAALVERVLADRPELGAIAAALPEGHEVIVPAIPRTAVVLDQVNLWD